jgi:pSer/pThr/pTyr-binding forkhead associated (FHA) protein
VVEDQGSREHAQLHLPSTAVLPSLTWIHRGTFVNGQRVIQGILYPGDVISLANCL